MNVRPDGGHPRKRARVGKRGRELDLTPFAMIWWIVQAGRHRKPSVTEDTRAHLGGVLDALAPASGRVPRDHEAWRA